jgi:hypothetical protein
MGLKKDNFLIDFKSIEIIEKFFSKTFLKVPLFDTSNVNNFLVSNLFWFFSTVMKAE